MHDYIKKVENLGIKDKATTLESIKDLNVIYLTKFY